MGNNLNRMNFELTNSDWTNSLKISSHRIDTAVDGDGEVVVHVSDHGDNSTRNARDVSWSLTADRSGLDEGDQGWIKTFHSTRTSLDLNELLVYFNLAFLALNFSFLGE